LGTYDVVFVKNLQLPSTGKLQLYTIPTTQIIKSTHISLFYASPCILHCCHGLQGDQQLDIAGPVSLYPVYAIKLARRAAIC